MTSLSAITPEIYRGRQLTDFRKYRDTYTADLPPGKVIPGDPRYDLYKCRTTFFSAVYTRVNLLIQRGLLPDTFQDFEVYMERDRNWREMASERDIAIIDEVIDRVIALLETPHNHTP